MAIQRNNLTRVFLYGGARLGDPSPAMSPVAVRDLLAAAGRPELSSAEIRGPEIVGNEMQYTLHRAVGTKGLAPNDQALPAAKKRAIAKMKKQLHAFGLGQIQANGPVAEAAAGLLQGSGKPVCPPSAAVPWFI